MCSKNMLINFLNFNLRKFFYRTTLYLGEKFNLGLFFKKIAKKEVNSIIFIYL